MGRHLMETQGGQLRVGIFARCREFLRVRPVPRRVLRPQLGESLVGHRANQFLDLRSQNHTLGRRAVREDLSHDNDRLVLAQK